VQVTTEQDTTTEPAEPGPWRPSRRAKITALVLAVLLVVGVTGAIVISNHNADAPVAAVREYVDAIARGDAAAANRMVDPGRFADGVDRALLSDEVLRSAKRRIMVEDVRLDAFAKLYEDVVEVQVDYTLGPNYDVTVVLRAQRAGTTAGVLADWQVIDPLLVPARVETNEPALETARLGAGTVPVSGPEGGRFPEHRFYVYPGEYEVGGHESRYLAAAPEAFVATTTSSDERPADIDRQVVKVPLTYRATPELVSAVADRLAPHVTACVAAVPNVPGDCPDPLRLYDSLPGIRLDRQPVIDSISSYQVEYQGDRTEPSLRMRADDGQFSFVDEDGERSEQRFSAYARIVVTPGDDLSITFTGAL
jgi:hypothetical protein